MLVNEAKIKRGGGHGDVRFITDASIAKGTTLIAFPQALGPEDDLLLRRSEVAALLRVARVLRHIGGKLLPIIKIGGAVRYRLSDVLALIEQKTDRTAAGKLPEPRGPGLPGQAS